MVIEKYKKLIQEKRNHDVIINNVMKMHESGAISYEQALELAVIQLKEKSDLYEKQLKEVYHKRGI